MKTVDAAQPVTKVIDRLNSLPPHLRTTSTDAFLCTLDGYLRSTPAVHTQVFGELERFVKIAEKVNEQHTLTTK